MRDKVNILLVDDEPGKLLSYEVMLSSLGENLIKADSGRRALECILSTEIAVVLVDVVMPDMDGFELATLIHQHPRYQKTALIFVSAVQIGDLDYLRGYECGAVDYVSVPVVPEILRARVSVTSSSTCALVGTSSSGSRNGPGSWRLRRHDCRRPTAAKISSSPCSPTNCATHSPPFGTRSPS